MKLSGEYFRDDCGRIVGNEGRFKIPSYPKYICGMIVGGLWELRDASELRADYGGIVGIEGRFRIRSYPKNICGGISGGLWGNCRN